MSGSDRDAKDGKERHRCQVDWLSTERFRVWGETNSSDGLTDEIPVTKSPCAQPSIHNDPQSIVQSREVNSYMEVNASRAAVRSMLYSTAASLAAAVYSHISKAGSTVAGKKTLPPLCRQQFL